jgi:hypothetical protein
LLTREAESASIAGAQEGGVTLSLQELRGFIAEGNPVIDSVTTFPTRGTSVNLGVKRPTIAQVRAAAERTGWQREVTVTYRLGPGGNGGGGEYYLWSVPYDMAGNAITDIYRRHLLIYHTHRAQDVASVGDMDFLRPGLYGQKSSIIIHRTDGPFVFTKDADWLPLQNGRR